MSEQSSEEKTEKPSAQRLKDAHNRGQVARSRDLVATAILLAVTLLLARMGGLAMTRMASRLMSGLARLGDHPRTTLTPADLGTLVTGDFMFFAMTVGPVLLTAAVIAVGANVMQS